MNSKKAKKLRQLVRHLTSKAGTPDQTEYTDNLKRKTELVMGKDGIMQPSDVIRTTRVLSTNCARAVYQQMKKNA